MRNYTNIERTNTIFYFIFNMKAINIKNLDLQVFKSRNHFIKDFGFHNMKAKNRSVVLKYNRSFKIPYNDIYYIFYHYLVF